MSAYLYVGFTRAGASIRACQATGRHIVAFEDDEVIFSEVLQPLIAKPPPPETAPKKASKKASEPTVQERPAKKPKRNRIACT